MSRGKKLVRIRRLSWGALLGIAGGLFLSGADWPTESGNSQRDGWLKGEKSLVKDKVRELKLLYKTALDNPARGGNALSTPLILGNLITYRGFKEMLFVGGSSDNVYSIDADLNRLLWKTHFDNRTANAAQGCSEGMTAGLAMPGSSAAAVRSFAARKTGAAAGPSLPSFFGGGFGRNGSVFAVGSDGYLRIVRQSDGNDSVVPPLAFLPPHSRVSGLNVGGTVVYAATLDECGGHPNALYAVDLGADERRVRSFPTNGSGPSGSGGSAIGTDGTVYLQVASGHGEMAGDYSDTVLALAPGELKVKDYFTPLGTALRKKGNGAAGVTPTVFQWKGRDVIVAGGADGRLYLLDSQSLGGSDHHTPMARSEPLAGASPKSASTGIWGDFATWEDADSNTRWIYAALRGPAKPQTPFPTTNGAVPNGSIVAFKAVEANGRLELAAQWISRDMLEPAAPVTTNGIVFALAAGDSGRIPRAGGKTAGHATMYALDGTTGKELFSTGNTVPSFTRSGLAVANGRVYFTTHENAIYCYGFPAEQPQLTEP